MVAAVVWMTVTSPGGTEMLLALRVTFLTVLHRKILLVFDGPKKFMTISQG